MADELILAPTIDLVNLPLPSIVETLDFELIYEENWALFKTFAPDYKYRLESDPVVKAIQAISYRELILRERINEGVRGQMLPFALENDLDILGSFWGVTRLVIREANENAVPPVIGIYESDERLRYRIMLRASGFANAGSADHYRYWAMSADARVKAVTVYSPDDLNGYNTGGQVIVVVLSTEGNYIPTEELLNKVRDIVLRSDVKVLTDVVSVEAAIPKVLDVTAQIVLLSNTPIAVYNASAERLRNEFNKRQKLGFDVTRSFLIDALFDDGIHSVTVTAPSVNMTVAPNEYPILGNINLTFAGFSDKEGYNIEDVNKIRAERYINENYVAYCVSTLRTQSEIMSDLNKVARPGIIEPTVVGVANYLGITAIKETNGSYIDENEIVYLIHTHLQARYNGA